MSVVTPTIAQGRTEGETFAVQNPATLEEIARVADLSPERVVRAIEQAQEAFPAWAGRPAHERAEILQQAARLMESRKEALALTLTLENGKPLANSHAEVTSAAKFLQWCGEEARRVYGRTIPSSASDRRYFALKQPVGVVAAITPWNFPLSMVTRKAAPALAAGCTVVLRPASATPLSALAAQDILREAGLPEGVFTVVTTKKSAPVGELFATHPLVRKLTFTGSTEVGKQLLKMAAGTVKRVSLELGGHAPFLVFEDADLESAAQGVIASKFSHSSQTCVSSNRLYVQRTLAEDFGRKVAEMSGDLRIGSGLDDGVQVGPLIDRSALDRMRSQVEDALERGARLLVGGKEAHPERLAGAFFEPTVLADVPHDAKIVHEETFGPILPMISFETEEEAIAAANDTLYGLAAYVFTRDVGRLFRVVERLEYGIIGANTTAAFDAQLPFGGVKESGLGRENGSEGIEAFLETKSVSIGL